MTTVTSSKTTCDRCGWELTAERAFLITMQTTHRDRPIPKPRYPAELLVDLCVGCEEAARYAIYDILNRGEDD